MNWTRNGEVRTLDFDCENRPLSYLGQDFTTAEVTAIAAGWIGKREIHCWLLGESTMEEMLSGFLELYAEAEIVTGHYIRKHDLPMLNGMLIEAGMPVLSAKMTSDTHGDLVKRQGISASQENLAGMMDVPEPKIGMNSKKWRAANRLLPEALDLTRQRAIGDVRQHKPMRKRMVELGYLGSPRMWRS